MDVIIKDRLKKYKNEIELKEMIIEIVNKIVGNCKNVEIVYEYGYTPLDDKIRGMCKYDNNEFRFECDEILGNLILNGIDVI